MQRLLAFLLFAASADAISAPTALSVQTAQIRQLKSYFNADNDWTGAVPERDVRWLAGMQLMGTEYRAVDLAATDDQKACARLCVSDLYCAAFTFTAPRCSLQYEGFTQQANTSYTSGIVRGP